MGWHWMMLACIVTLVTVGAAAGDTLVVDDDEGAWAGFTTLQSAIWNASDGDTIRVYNGTYGENVIVNVSVSIVGNVSQESLILGDRSSSTIRIEAPDTTLEALRISGGSSLASYGAVRIYSVDGVTVVNCSIYDNEGTGIYVHDVDGIDIVSCGIYDTDGHGVLLDDSTDATLVDVVFTECGLFMTGNGATRYNSHTITGCTVNGRVLYYRENQHGLVVPAGAGQVILANCNAVMVRGLNITGKGSVGALLAHCNFIADLIEFDGCSFSGMKYGVYLHRVSNLTLGNSTIFDCSNAGVFIGSGTDGILISESSIDGCLYGIQASGVSGLDILNCTLGGNVQNGIDLGNGCDGAIISNVMVNGSWIGVGISMSDGVELSNLTSGWNGRLGVEIDQCDDIVLVDCHFHDNSGGGAELVDCIAPSITLSTFQDNSGTALKVTGTEAAIMNNTIAGNSGNGMELAGQLHVVKLCDLEENLFGIFILEGASNLTIRNNDLRSNDGYGIYCDSDLENITFLRNDLADNNNGSVQAHDDGNHTWDDGTRGNWWSDHESTDDDGDGVWDTPYPIDGPGDSKDRFPLRGAADILTVEIFSDPEDGALIGQAVTIIVQVDVEIGKKDASVRIYRDDVVVFTQVVDLEIGRNFYIYNWTATEGEYVFRASVEGHTTEEDTMSMSVIPVDDSEPETDEGIPSWALAATMLFVSFLIVFNLKRFFLPKKD